MYLMHLHLNSGCSLSFLKLLTVFGHEKVTEKYSRGSFSGALTNPCGISHNKTIRNSDVLMLGSLINIDPFGKTIFLENTK